MKTIRLFISSTFRDMNAERDWLNRVVFPELRSRCRRRGAEFVGVDLRWGVTEEEARQRGALTVCLDEIGRCDLFLGLVGERYGWVPPPEEVPAELFAAVRDGGQASDEEIALMDACYQWDRTTVPARFRLRRDVVLPPETAETLTRLWQRSGLPGAGESVTALEILHGALALGQSRGKAIIYLRSEGIHRHPGFPPTFVPIFAEAHPEARQRLARLREEVRSAASPTLVVREYRPGYAGFRIDPLFLPATVAGAALGDGVIEPGEWEELSEAARQAVTAHGTVALTGIEEFGTRVLNDLWFAMEPLLKNGKRPEITGQSWHERFARERAARCFGRDDGVAAVMGYLRDHGDHSPYVLTGLPGCGKSTLMAACVERLREESPDTVVIPWFVGAAPGSTELTAMVRSLCEQLRRACRLDLEPSPDPDKLRLQLPAFLAAARAVRPVALFIDALNQLDPVGGSHELAWFPRTLAPGVKVVASTLAGPCLDRLTERLPADHLAILPPLADDSRATLMEEHLARRGKRLSLPQQTLLLDTEARPEAALPLYLVAALEELCCHGDFETLAERIAALPPTVAELFDQILERLERDHGANLATTALSAIAVSRDGLLEPEIIDLLREGGEATASLPWTRFYRALEPYLRPSGEEGGGGLISFFHDQLRFAAFRRYLAMDTPAAVPSGPFRQTHGRLADYFRAGARKNGADGSWNPERPRPLAELPFHLAGAGRQTELRALVFDFPWLQAKFQALDVAALLADIPLLPPEPALALLELCEGISPQQVDFSSLHLPIAFFSLIQQAQQFHGFLLVVAILSRSLLLRPGFFHDSRIGRRHRRGEAGVVLDQGYVRFQAVTTANFHYLIKQEGGQPLSGDPPALGFGYGLLNQWLDHFRLHFVPLRNRVGNDHPTFQARRPFGVEQCGGFPGAFHHFLQLETRTTGVKGGQFPGFVPYHGHALGLQILQGLGKVEYRLGASADDADAGPRKFFQVGGDVPAGLGPPVHAPHAACGENADPGQKGHDHSPRHGGRAGAAGSQKPGEIPARSLGHGAARPGQDFQLRPGEPGAEAAFHKGHRGGDGPAVPYQFFNGERGFQILGPGHAMADYRRLQGDHRFIRPERGGHFLGDRQVFVHGSRFLFRDQRGQAH